jgi:threonine dehydrogenase-like Zn-dependent dehydrogenase
MGSVINRGLILRVAQTTLRNYLPKLMKLVEEERIDPSFIITDRARLGASSIRNSGTERKAVNMKPSA